MLSDSRIVSAYISPNPELMADTAPAGRWEYDILAEEKLLEGVEAIKTASLTS